MNKRESCRALPAIAPAALAVFATWQASAAPRMHRATRVQHPPAVSGATAADGQWSLMDGFTNAGGQPASVATEARAYYDDENLYLIVVCHEPDMSELVARAEGHDVDVFSDDCVEVFIRPSASRGQYFHFATNALGARYEEEGRDKSWDGPWSVRAKAGTDRWTLQVTIPLASLAGKPSQSSIWRVNVNRQRRRDGKLELMSWSPTGSNFHDVDNFGRLIFSDDYLDSLRRNIVEPWRARSQSLRHHAAISDVARAQSEERLREIARNINPIVQATTAGTPISGEAFVHLLAQGEAAIEALHDAEREASAAIADAERAQKLRKLARGKKVLAYAVRAITNEKIMPVPKPPEKPSRVISLRACRGEYEPGSFVVYPLDEDVTVEASVTQLRSSSRRGKIPASAVDIRTVKRWYQAGASGSAPRNQGVRLLTPELLLHDDGLVRVDHEKKENYVRLSFPDGKTKWLWVSSPDKDPKGTDYSVEAMPIKDADSLQPVTVPARTAKQFWVTVLVPDDAKPGEYSGKIRLRSGKATLDTLTIKLEVLPFELQPNHLESSIYFHWGIELIKDGPGTIMHNRRSLDQYRAELENLLAHGIDNPTMGVPFGSGLLPVALRIRQEVGMANDHLYYLKAYASQTSPEQVKEIIKIAREFGFEDVYFYGQDEARGDALKKQRPIWERIHEAGGKIFVAGYRGNNFPAVGDLQDLLVCAGPPSKEEAALWHSKGHKIFCYANPQSGIEEPETYRRNFGLRLDVNDYDGGMTYIYYHGWNDFNIKPWRQHNFIYPTVDGGVDTVEWEGYREGIDDLRYLNTLRHAIAEAEQAGGTGAREARRAKRFIEKLDVAGGDLYAIRDAMIGWIIKLQSDK